MSPRSKIIGALRDLQDGRMTVREFLGLFAGKRIPSMKESARETLDRRAYELAGQVGTTIAAQRLGISRPSVYRAIARHSARELERRKAA